MCPPFPFNSKQTGRPSQNITEHRFLAQHSQYESFNFLSKIPTFHLWECLLSSALEKTNFFCCRDCWCCCQCLVGERVSLQSSAHQEDSLVDAESNSHLFRSGTAGRVSLYWLLNISWKVCNKSMDKIQRWTTADDKKLMVQIFLTFQYTARKMPQYRIKNGNDHIPSHFWFIPST